MFNRLSYLLVCLLLFASTPRLLAEDAAPASQSIPAEMARLIPAEAVGFAYTDSVTGFTTSLTQLVSAINPQMGGMVAFMGPASMLQQQVSTQKKVMTDGPAGIAFWPGATLNDPPNYAVIFSIEDASPSTVRAMGRGSRLIFLEGTNWLAVSHGGSSWTPAAEDAPTPSLAQGLLPGAMAINLDVKKFNSMNRDAMDNWTGNVVVDRELLSIAESISQFGMSMAMSDGNVDLAMQYTPTLDSKTAMKGDNAIVALSNRLPGDLPMQMVMGNSMLEAVAWLFFEERMQDKQHLAALESALDAMQAEVVDGVGMSMGMSEYGLDLVKVFEVKDAARMFSMMDSYIAQLNDAKIGMNIERMKVLVGGDSARAYRVTAEGPDAAQLRSMLGPDGMIIRIISNKNMMAAVTGAPKLLGRTRRALTQASAAETVIDSIATRSGGEMIMGMSMDLRAFMRGIVSYLQNRGNVLGSAMDSGELMGIAQVNIGSAPPTTVDASVSSHGDVVKMELDVEVVKIYKLYTEINDQIEAIQAKRKAEEAEAAKEAAGEAPDKQ